MAATLDRAGVEYDLAGDNGGERVPYTTDAEDGSAANGQSSKKDRLTRKVKKIMHINKPVAAIPEPSVGVTLAPSPDSPSTTAQLGEDVREKGLSGLEDFVHQPVQTVRATMQRRTNREAAETFVTAEIPHAKNVELIQAQDRRTEAKTREEQITAEHDVETLKKARQDSFVRWTIDRHVKKIRRLERDRIPRRARADFVRKDRGGAKKTDWNAYCTHLARYSAEKYGAQYIGSFAEPTPATQDTISASVERLILASSSLQAMIMHMRRIYRWDNRNETSMYLGLFLLLWAINLVVPALLVAIVVQVFRRRHRPPTVEKIRDHVRRVENTNLKAITLAEHIEKRGDHNWIEPLLAELGPWLQLQLGDLANLFEVIINFYEWRTPRRTIRTIVILATVAFSFCFTPSWLLGRLITLFSGFVFFGLFPIGTRYPEYRLLVSPIKWLFWDIPNHSEWAIARLQVEGARQGTPADQDGRFITKHVAATPAERIRDDTHMQNARRVSSWDQSIKGAEHDTSEIKKESSVLLHGAYTCSSEKHSGRLLVTSVGVRFEPGPGSGDHFEIEYINLDRLEKINHATNSGSGEDLLFNDAKSQRFVLSNVTSRDEVFTQIIGYSSVAWQVLG